MQDGVVGDGGPTLEDIMDEEKVAKQHEETTLEQEDVVDESPNEADSGEEAVDNSSDEDQDSVKSDDADYESMTVAQLKELLKDAGKPVSGKKADLISRLSE